MAMIWLKHNPDVFDSFQEPPAFKKQQQKNKQTLGCNLRVTNFTPVLN